MTHLALTDPHAGSPDRPGPSRVAVPDGVRRIVRWGLGHALPRTVLRSAARRGDLQGRLVVAAAGRRQDEVEAVIEEVRADGPLHASSFAFVTADHATVKEVLTGNDFRAGLPTRGGGVLGRLGRWAAAESLHPVEPPSLLVTEPPDHTRYRKLVTRVFTVRAVEQLRERTEEIAAALLDDLAPRRSDRVDIVEDYCALLPVTVIAEILGVPPEERRRVLDMGAAAAPSLDLGLPWGQYRQVDVALADFDAWLGTHLEQLREHPGDDLLSQLVAAREDGVGLTPVELKSIAGLVLAAGFETTVNLLGNGIALFDEHPDQLGVLREQPDLWPNAVDEILRVDPPVLLTGRTAARDTVVAGVEVPRGRLVTTILGGANRDPAVFEDPDRFDVARANARDHVAFSAGRHYCLGAALARMEGEVGLRALYDRYPDLTVLRGARRRPTRVLRGFETLPVRLS